MSTKEQQWYRDAVAWAYQAIGARWPNVEALDNLSAVLAGKEPPHEWPVVPPGVAHPARPKCRFSSPPDAHMLRIPPPEKAP